MTEIMEATWAESMPNDDGDQRYWRVTSGATAYRQDGRLVGVTVTRITVQRDLPGPLHNAAGVGFALPEKG